MRIAVIGCGAMGALYGGYLSRNNDVTLVERNPDRIAKIRADGLRIAEPDGSAAVYRPGITGDTSGMAPADLVILFVKSMQSEAALDEANVVRYARYMRRIAGKTQFIVITHRRGTMEEADVLYGVTMQEKGVSRILTINLNDMAKELKIK